MKEPTFGGRKELVRYIDEINRLSGNRAAPAAFIDLPDEDPSKHHLSVNSTELETVREIAFYFREKMRPTDGKVALSIHKVHVYSEAGRDAGIAVTYNEGSEQWEFVGLKRTPEAAYKHRPLLASDLPIKSTSHCGVEFARMMNEHTALKFARRLTKGKFQVFSK